MGYIHAQAIQFGSAYYQHCYESQKEHQRTYETENVHRLKAKTVQEPKAE
jgi:hypothetical protein